MKQKRNLPKLLPTKQNKQTIHLLCGEALWLLPEKCIYWEKERCLIISDLHLGKIDHFRKNGLAIPVKAILKNYELLNSLFKRHKPSEVIFLGDLFHSDHNHDWERFKGFLGQYTEIKFILVKGNHDILNTGLFENLLDEIYTDGLIKGPFYFSHEPVDHSLYNICGHIHPSVIIKGQGQQSLRLPCFFFENSRGILPAFGVFTGSYSMEPKKNDDVYIVCDDEVVPL